MNKRVFGIFGVVVAVGIGIAVSTGLFPPKKDMVGTIGAAKRATTEQISTGDVAIDPAALNDLMQSDVVHRLVKDPEFKKAIASENFRNLVASGEFQRLVKSSDFVSLVSRPEFGKLSTTGEWSKVSVALDAARGGMYMSKATATTEASKTSKATAGGELDKTAKATTELEKTSKASAGGELDKTAKAASDYAKVDWGKAKLSADAEKIVKSPEFEKLINASPDFGKLITSSDFAKTYLASPDFGKLLTSGDFLKVATTEVGAKALASPELQKMSLATTEH